MLCFDIIREPEPSSAYVKDLERFTNECEAFIVAGDVDAILHRMTEAAAKDTIVGLSLSISMLRESGLIIFYFCLSGS